MKLIIDINEELYNEMKSLPYNTILEQIILNGAPLEEELEKIKVELHKRIKTQYDACFGDEGDVYCFHKAYEVSDIIIDNVFDKHISELKGEREWTT